MDEEIEVKLNYENKEKIVEILKQLNAKFEKKFELHDTYYGLGHSSMNNKNNLVRIRKKGDKSELTFKGNCIDTENIWKRTEITTQISNPEKMNQILLNLGLNKIKENKSIREEWKIGNTEILFIDFTHPEELKIIEIEAESNEEIQEILNKLGNLVTRTGEESFKRFDKKTSKMQKLLIELKKLKLPIKEFSVFGSGPIAIRGLKEPGDLDIIVTESLWNELKEKYELIKKKGYEYLTINGIDIFHDWTHQDYDLDKLIKESEIIEGIRFVKLKEVLEWKKRRNNPKDKQDIKLIEEYLSKQ